MPLLFDLHLDLAWNALSFNRDLLLPLAELREQEASMHDVPGRGCGTITFPEMRKGKVGTCLATLLVRSGPDQSPQGSYARSDLDFATQAIAYSVAQGQLAYYHLLEQQGHIRLLRTVADLNRHHQAWSESPETARFGFIISMEGADPIVEPEQAAQWWDAGLRVIGPAHYGRSHYAYGTAVEGPVSKRGMQLLDEMERLGFVLDVTHLCDWSMAEALDRFSGPVLASHHNCRTFVPGDRQLTDAQIRQLLERDAIIGMAFDAWMLYSGWERGITQPTVVSLDDAVNHIDHICELAGNTDHVAIGSDLDGGFGTEQTPHDLNTIADLQKLADLLAGRGYSDAAINGIFHGNALRFFQNALPET